MPGSKKPQRWYDEGYLRKGDTIEELAGATEHEARDACGQRSIASTASWPTAGTRISAAVSRAYDRWLGDPSSQALGDPRQHLRRAFLRRPGGTRETSGPMAAWLRTSMHGSCARMARSFPVSMRPAFRRHRSWGAPIRVPAAASGQRSPSATSPRSMPRRRSRRREMHGPNFRCCNSTCRLRISLPTW